MLNIAHRGASSLAPENTLEAAERALAVGADMWEIDITASADGELILLHDETLSRTTNVTELFPQRAPWLAHEFTLSEIHRLDAGAWFNETDPFGQIEAGTIPAPDLDSYLGLPLPTLREALNFTKAYQWRVNIEIKDMTLTPHEPTFVEDVVDLVEALGMLDTVLFSSFKETYLRRVKAENATAATALLAEKRPYDLIELLDDLEVAAYHPALTAIEPAEIATFQERGYAVNVWTVNDVATMQRLIEAGVDGLITDFPQRLTQLKGAQPL